MKSLHGIAAVGTFLAALLSVLLLRPSSSFREADIRSDKDWFMAQRLYPGTALPKRVAETMKCSMELFDRKTRSTDATTSAAGSWTMVGPTNIGGRVNAIVIHPTNPSIIYAGAASGGVWKSTDFGSTWANVFNESFSIGAVAMDPADPATLYVGTGEANPSSVDTYPGNGLWKSTDAGATWSNIGLPETGHIGRIVVNPLNRATVYVAALGLYRSKNTDKGVYKTTDGGATWGKILFVDDTTGVADIAMDPSDTSRLLASSFTYYRTLPTVYRSGPGSTIHLTTDAGASWIVPSGIPSGNPDIGRIAIDFAPSNPAIVYALVASAGGYSWDGVYKSVDHGSTWTKSFDNAGLGWFTSESQVWYNCIIRVHPTNPNILWAGMTYLYKSLDGGATFSYASVVGDYHVDHHDIAYAPSNPSQMVFGNDGGVFTSSNGGGTWLKSLNLPITQFYFGSIAAQDPKYLLGGTQDNSSMRTFTSVHNDWSIFYGGDGFYCLVDPTDLNYVYAEYQNGGLAYSTDGGASFWGGTTGISGSEPRNWAVPIAMDPQHPKTLYTGTNYLYKTTNNMQSWTKISPLLTTNQPGFFSTLSTIDVAPTDSNVVYAGTGDGKVWVTTNGGGTWQDVSAGLPLRWISRVTADPMLANVAYVALSGFREYDSQGHLYRTTTYGASWTDIGTALPDIPVNDVVVDPLMLATLYVATDLNVLTTSNLGVSWSVLGSNLPSVTVHDLALHAGARKLAAFTHGRSVYTYDLPVPVGTSVVVQLRPRWNLVSNPVQAANNSVHALFPDAQGKAFKYTAGGTYQLQDSILPGSGYWLKFPDAAGLSSVISGTSVTGTTIPVHQGWNLVGSLTSDVPFSQVAGVGTTILSPLYAYEGTYRVSDSLRHGRGYWLRVNQAGTLTVSSSLARSSRPESQLLSSLPALTIRDADGNAQELFLAVGRPSIDRERYALPPPAPEGAFSVRFRSNVLVETAQPGGGRFPIDIASASFPVILSWSGRGEIPSVRIMAGGLDLPLREGTSVVLAEPASSLTLAVGDGLPSAFVLEQNFPNPFNPSTTIAFELPEARIVDLTLYDAAGREVASLLNDAYREPGRHEVRLNGQDLASGVYLYRLTARRLDGPGAFTEARKMLLVK